MLKVLPNDLFEAAMPLAREDLDEARLYVSRISSEESQPGIGSSDISCQDHCPIPPLAMIAREQVAGFFRSPGARRVIGKIARRQRVPDVQDRLHDAPAGFDHVGALEQSGVADHAVVEQALVARAGLAAEVVGVVESPY